MYNGEFGGVRSDSDLFASKFNLRLSRRTCAALQDLRHRLRGAVQGLRRQRPAAEGSQSIRQSVWTSGQSHRQVSVISACLNQIKTFRLKTFRL